MFMYYLVVVYEAETSNVITRDTCPISVNAVYCIFGPTLLLPLYGVVVFMCGQYKKVIVKKFILPGCSGGPGLAKR